MRMMTDGVIRDMTAEEEEAFFAAHNEREEPSAEDYAEALTRLGVTV